MLPFATQGNQWLISMYADHEAGYFWGRLTSHPHHVWQVRGARCTQCPSPLRCNKFVCHAQSLDVDGLPDNGCEVPECFVILLFCVCFFVAVIGVVCVLFLGI